MLIRSAGGSATCVFRLRPRGRVFCGCENVATTRYGIVTYVVRIKQPVVGGAAELPSGVVIACRASGCNSGIIAGHAAASYAQFVNMRQRRARRPANPRVSRRVSGSHVRRGTRRWPVAVAGGQRRFPWSARLKPVQANRPGPRPKTQDPRRQEFGFVLSRRCPRRPHLSSAG